MTTLPERKLTAAEYLVIERDAPFKSEYYAGEMFRCPGPARPTTASRIT
jgi:hypothetical protein